MRMIQITIKRRIQSEVASSTVAYHLGAPEKNLAEVNSPDDAIPHDGTTFETIKKNCLAKKTLYEDKTFPADDSSLYYSQALPVKVTWKRPNEIVSNPSFFVSGASRFDVIQGLLGDCWLLAAVAALCHHESLFHQVVPRDQKFTNEGNNEYCGAFKFRFWQYGRWEEVVVDDRLPTYKNKLVFQHSSENNEFWSALLEKAYAKLVGSYEALKGGQTSEAMEDFTGGVAETFILSKIADDFFDILCKVYERQSLMCCSIDGKADERMENGLYKGHAYTVTGVKKVTIHMKNGDEEIELIRLRNPWGNEREWNGAWSDKSAEWKMLCEDEKIEMKLTYAHDGEFWMTFEDFKANFSKLELCLLSPDAAGDVHAKKWETKIYQGTWQKYLTAGGCRNFPDTFHMNPQFRATFEDPDDENDVVDNCTVVIGLIQKGRRKQKRHGIHNLVIGFSIYQLSEGFQKYIENGRLGKDFFLKHKAFAHSPNFFNLREVTGRYSLPPGEYVILPSSYESNKEGDFVLRLFSEKPYNSGIIDARTEGEVRQTQSKATVKEKESFDTRFRKFFNQVAGQDGEVDSFELQNVLSAAFKTEMEGQQFCLEACRSMLCMADRDRNGKLNFDEFRELWLIVMDWKKNFKTYDKDNSGDMSAIELRGALANLGYTLSTQAMSSLTLRYSNRNGNVSVDDYVQICCRIKSCFECFSVFTGTSFTLDAFIMASVYT